MYLYNYLIDISFDQQFTYFNFNFLSTGFDPEIPGFPRYSMKVEQSVGIFNLQINNVQLEDEGDYQCQVTQISK